MHIFFKMADLDCDPLIAPADPKAMVPPRLLAELQHNGILVKCFDPQMEGKPSARFGGVEGKYDPETMTATITIKGVIFEKSWLADMFFGNGYVNMADLQSVMEEMPNECTSVHLQIDSPGGQVTEGWAIMNYLKKCSKTVTTECIGMAASMGSVLFCMGSERVMNENTSMIMIHECSSCACGGVADFEAIVQQMRDINTNMASIYSKSSNKKYTQSWFEKEMGKSPMGVYFDSDTALEMGLATKVIEFREADDDPEKTAQGGGKSPLQKYIDEKAEGGDNTPESESVDDATPRMTAGEMAILTGQHRRRA